MTNTIMQYRGVVASNPAMVATATAIAFSEVTALEPPGTSSGHAPVTARQQQTRPIRIEIENTSDVEIQVTLGNGSVLSNAGNRLTVCGDYHLTLEPFERCSMVIDVLIGKD